MEGISLPWRRPSSVTSGVTLLSIIESKLGLVLYWVACLEWNDTYVM